MDSKIKIAVVGRGKMMLDRFVQAFRGIDGVAVVAISDQDKPLVPLVEHAADIPLIVDDWRDLLSVRDIDALAICTEPSVQEKILESCISERKHAFVHWPPATSLAKAKTLAQGAAGCRGTIISVAPASLSLPFEEVIAPIVHSGALGPIAAVDVLSTTRDSLLKESTVEWWERRVDRGIDTLRIAAFGAKLMEWVGPYESLSASAAVFIKDKQAEAGNGPHADVPQVVMVQGKLRCGALGVEYHGSVVADKKAPRQLVTLYGLQGTVRFDCDLGQVTMARLSSERFDPVDTSSCRSHWRVENDFVQCIRAARLGYTVPMGDNVTLDKSIPLFQRLEAITQSSASSRVISLDAL